MFQSNIWLMFCIVLVTCISCWFISSFVFSQASSEVLPLHCKNILAVAAASHNFPFNTPTRKINGGIHNLFQTLWIPQLIFRVGVFSKILAEDRYICTSNKIFDCHWKLNVNQFCVCGWISGATADVERPQKFLRLDQLSDNYFIYQSLFLFWQHLPSSCKQNINVAII